MPNTAPKTRGAQGRHARVVALPFLNNLDGADLTGLSVAAPGAYAEQTLVQESPMH